MDTLEELGGVQVDAHSVDLTGRDAEFHIQIRTGLAGVAHPVHRTQGSAQIGFGAGVHPVVPGRADGGGQVGFAVGQLQLQFGDGVVIPAAAGAVFVLSGGATGTGPEAEGHVVLGGAVAEPMIFDVHQLAHRHLEHEVTHMGNPLIFGVGQLVHTEAAQTVHHIGEVGTVLHHGGGGILGTVDVDFRCGIGAPVIGGDGHGTPNCFSIGDVGADARHSIELADGNLVDAHNGIPEGVAVDHIEFHILMLKQLIGRDEQLIQVGDSDAALGGLDPGTGAVEAVVSIRGGTGGAAVEIVPEIHPQVLALHHVFRNGGALSQVHPDHITVVLHILQLGGVHGTHGGGGIGGVDQHLRAFRVDLQVHGLTIGQVGAAQVGIGRDQPAQTVSIRLKQLNASIGIAHGVLVCKDIHRGAGADAVGTAQLCLRGNAGQGSVKGIAEAPQHRSAAGGNRTAGGAAHVAAGAGAVLVELQNLPVAFPDGVGHLVILVQVHCLIRGIDDLDALHLVAAGTVGSAAVDIVGPDLGDVDALALKALGGSGGDQVANLGGVDMAGAGQSQVPVDLQGTSLHRNLQLHGVAVPDVGFVDGLKAADGLAGLLTLEAEGSVAAPAVGTLNLQHQSILGDPQILPELRLRG